MRIFLYHLYAIIVSLLIQSVNLYQEPQNRLVIQLGGFVFAENRFKKVSQYRAKRKYPNILISSILVSFYLNIKYQDIQNTRPDPNSYNFVINNKY